jgi:cell division septation protein DedD
VNDQEPAEIAAAAEPPAGYRSATDPWDNPLPEWDQSQNEWPVLLAGEKQSRLKSLRVPIAIALVIASAAAVYFLLLRPGADSPPRPESNIPQKPLEVAAPDSGQAQPADNTARPAEANDVASQAAPQSALVPAGEGPFSLQVASMPDRAEALRMAEGLKASGLPAYVVEADLGRRGVWHRVRVGKFATAEEAQKFAASSRLRADVTRD